MTQLSDDLLIRLEATLRSAGRDTSKLQAKNPLDPEFDGTKGGRETRMIVESLNPQLYAELKAATSGGTQQSLGYTAAMARGDNPATFTGALLEEWQAANPAVAIKAASQAETDQLAAWEEQAQAKEFQRVLRESGGNEAEAKRRIAAGQQAEQQRQAKLEADRQHADAMNRRIQQRQRELDRAAKIAQGNTFIN